MPTVDNRSYNLPSALAAAALLIGLCAPPAWAADEVTTEPAATGSAMRVNIDPETGKFSTDPSSSAPSPRAAFQEELPVAANVVAPGAVDIDVSSLLNNYMNVHVTTDGKVKAGCETTPASAKEAEVK